jgi:hypothetical protein
MDKDMSAWPTTIPAANTAPAFQEEDILAAANMEAGAVAAKAAR